MVGVSGDRQQLSPPAMHQLSRDLTKSSDQCLDIAKFLKSPLGSMWWQSRAATSFKENIDQVVDALNKLSPLFTAVGKDVEARAKQLEVTRND
jgi:hypothetical protein